MSSHTRLTVFSLVACITYTVTYYSDWPAFRYYLGSGNLSLSIQPESAGAPILWYGWVLMAALVGLFSAIVLPRALTVRAPADLLWIIPAATILAAVLYEMRWFI